MRGHNFCGRFVDLRRGSCRHGPCGEREVSPPCRGPSEDHGSHPHHGRHGHHGPRWRFNPYGHHGHHGHHEHGHGHRHHGPHDHDHGKRHSHENHNTACSRNLFGPRFGPWERFGHGREEFRRRDWFWRGSECRRSCQKKDDTVLVRGIVIERKRPNSV